MDQQKIGLFLKTLRKEKGMTQEQIAEVFNVSRRTVTRWETGVNMPDLDILVEIADYYDVDLRELFDGERKSEKMNEEMKDTLKQVAEYGEEEKKKLKKKMIDISGAAVIILLFIRESCAHGSRVTCLAHTAISVSPRRSTAAWNRAYPAGSWAFR